MIPLIDSRLAAPQREALPAGARLNKYVYNLRGVVNRLQPHAKRLARWMVFFRAI